MKYYNVIRLKNGGECLLRSAEPDDAAELVDIFMKTHAESDFLTTYPDEKDASVDGEREFLTKCAENDDSTEICAFIGGVLVGSAGYSPVGRRDKLKHRADFGISILRDYCGRGIGRALTNACTECARDAGYLQIELEVVADNAAAVALYKSAGYAEFGRNPRGFRTREGRYQEIVYMKMELG